MEDPVGEMLEAWRTNHRLNTFLIDEIGSEGMKCTLSKRGGRNVVRQFCHLHNVRFWQLEARAKDLVEGLHKFQTNDEPAKATLKKHLNASSKRIERFLKDCAAGAPKRRPFKKGVIPFLGYLIAHESHHRGSIMLTLKQCGHSPEKSVRYALWGKWDKG